MKKTIALDMDNVIADVESHYIDWYHREFGVMIDRKTLLGKHEAEAFPDPDAIWRFLFTPGFFRTVPVMEGAQQAVAELSRDFEIYIVSAAMEFPQSLPEKLDWLKEHFPAIGWKHIIFCGNKGIIGTDYMIDDHIKNLDHFSGKPILYTASHNVNITHHFRVNNWPEAVQYLQSTL
ncbi:MAG: 5'(3')-deoxyribonucleotidase [Mucilaginibacter polytrichastri]|nr:5'(3')-deoxyribonucleotidase [Mucilaginibacter polytrichastri]